MKLKIKPLNPLARVPEYATDGSGAFDLIAADDGAPHPKDPHATIFGTGWAFEIPPGHLMLVLSRSGHGFNEAIRLSNCVGLIDSDYRGEVKVALRFDGSDELRCKKVRQGDRIAQAVVLPIEQVQFDVTDTLSDTTRGAGGFGSTDGMRPAVVRGSLEDRINFQGHVA